MRTHLGRVDFQPLHLPWFKVAPEKNESGARCTGSYPWSLEGLAEDSKSCRLTREWQCCSPNVDLTKWGLVKSVDRDVVALALADSKVDLTKWGLAEIHLPNCCCPRTRDPQPSTSTKKSKTRWSMTTCPRVRGTPVHRQNETAQANAIDDFQL